MTGTGHVSTTNQDITFVKNAKKLIAMNKEKFKAWRLKKNISQEKLAYILGTSQQTIGKIEKGIIKCFSIEDELNTLIHRSKIAKKLLEEE